jgi:hypothetical protein
MVYTQIPDWYLGGVPEPYFNALSDVTGLPPATACIEFWLRLAKAKNPFPVDMDRDVHPAVVLAWQAGDTAALHDVYLGTDSGDVANADTSTAGIYRGRQTSTEYDPPGVLLLGKTYFWRIDEVNSGYADSKGDVWSFATAAYIIFDDMESYCGDYGCGNEIYDTWRDGWENGSSSVIALGVALSDVNRIYIGLGDRVGPTAGGYGSAVFDDISLYAYKRVLPGPEGDLTDTASLIINTWRSCRRRGSAPAVTRTCILTALLILRTTAYLPETGSPTNSGHRRQVGDSHYSALNHARRFVCACSFS